MARMAVIKLIDIDDDDKLPFAIPLVIFLTVTVIKIMISNILSHKTVSSCLNDDWCRKKVISIIFHNIFARGPRFYPENKTYLTVIRPRSFSLFFVKIFV